MGKSLVLKNSFLFLALSFLILSCGPKSEQQASVGVPKGPDTEASVDSFNQGLKFIRENPSDREDERVQHFLWLDQWISIFERSNKMTPEFGQELYKDLVSFVTNPDLGKASLERIGGRAETQMGKNVASYYLYLNSLKESTLEAALAYLKSIQPDPYSDLHSKATELLSMPASGGAASGKVGVLVPLTGDLKNFGKEVMDSLQTLSGFAGSEGMEFVFVDTGTTNDSLQAAFQKLVSDENVVAIIGPVTSSASQFVFERADLTRVPVISLAPR